MGEKTVREVLDKVKASAEVGSNRLRLQVGRRALTVPIGIRLVQGEKFLYLNVPSSVGLYSIGPDGLERLTEDQPSPAGLEEDLQRGVGGVPTLPSELADQLRASVPPGYKLTLVKGEIRILKERKRNAH